ncbi:MAG: ABC transporter permease [Candidatus Bipolaricaulota bacterium]|nr:ABC transporter permease [Candidatus Bipolaricaulota bacterium]
MIQYAIRRLLWMVAVLFGVMTIIFFISRVIPADPVAALLGPQAPPEVIERLKAKWDLDKPLWNQYGIFLWRAVQGDLGVAISTNRPVTSDLAQFFPPTFELATSAFLVSLLVGILLGVISATRRGKLADHVSRVVALVGISMPVFWVGLLLLLLFYYVLHWLPGGGQLPFYMAAPTRVTGLMTVDSLLAGQPDIFVEAVRHLVLPTVVVSFYGIAVISRITRSSMLDALGEDYVRTARGKGLRENRVVLRHALRNALLPVITTCGIVYARTLEGAVIAETIFSWPGLGRYATNAFLAVDFPAVVGATGFIALMFAGTNLVVDLSYALVNPRIRYT